MNLQQYLHSRDRKAIFCYEKMKEDGCAIIFITHKLDEVMEVADKLLY